MLLTKKQKSSPEASFWYSNDDESILVEESQDGCMISFDLEDFDKNLIFSKIKSLEFEYKETLSPIHSGSCFFPKMTCKDLVKHLMIDDMNTLSDEILNFLEKHAKLKPLLELTDDPYEERFTSPDASEMYACAFLMKKGCLLGVPNSSWESCGYAPYRSEKARQIHDYLISSISILYDLIK